MQKKNFIKKCRCVDARLDCGFNFPKDAGSIPIESDYLTYDLFTMKPEDVYKLQMKNKIVN